MSAHVLTDMEKVRGAMIWLQTLKPWLAGGRRKLMAELAHGRRIILPGSPEAGKNKTLPPDAPSHADALYAMRASIPSQPEVKTPELMAEYRRLMNLRKTIRRALRAA